MNSITAVFNAFSRNAREKRAVLFRSAFRIDENTTILDLGSENGANMHAVLKGTGALPGNVYIADIDKRAVAEGHHRFGYVPVELDESGEIPFPDHYFDIVYCSSVIEHVTVTKDRTWSLSSGPLFRLEATRNQQKFAREIERVGKQYFIQTPYKHFPIESHTWLPFFAYLPRPLSIALMRVSNVCWVKDTIPDFHLLARDDMARLFPSCHLLEEKAFGLTKSLIALKTLS